MRLIPAFLRDQQLVRSATFGVLLTLVVCPGFPAAVVAVAILPARQQYQRERVQKVDLPQLAQALVAYRAQGGAFPKQLEQLRTAGVIGEVPRDPWGGPYRFTPLLNGTAWLASSGLDGDVGTDDDIVCLAAEASSMDACDR